MSASTSARLKVSIPTRSEAWALHIALIALHTGPEPTLVHAGSDHLLESIGMSSSPTSTWNCCTRCNRGRSASDCPRYSSRNASLKNARSTDSFGGSLGDEFRRDPLGGSLRLKWLAWSAPPTRPTLLLLLVPLLLPLFQLGTLAPLRPKLAEPTRWCERDAPPALGWLWLQWEGGRGWSIADYL